MTDVLTKINLEDPEVIFAVSHGKGWIKFNRPQVLNCLSFQMMQGLYDILPLWAQDPRVRAVVVQGEGPRAFCSGGDLRAVYDAQSRHDDDFLKELFRVEYSTNLRLKAFPKPYISLIHGYTMGGGIGACIHGSHRIVAENAVLAMPETGIGYFPDIGATHFLHQCPGYSGLYLGLTGVSISGFDAMYAGWATHHVPLERFAALENALQESQDVIDVVNTFAIIPGLSGLENQQQAIDQHFGHSSLEDIFASLATDSSSFAQDTLKILESRCPLSLKVTFEQVQATKGKTFLEVMTSEYYLSQQFVRHPDFHEGIRAAIIDKDRTPRWHHKSIHQVTADDLAPFFKDQQGRFSGAQLSLKD